MLRFVVLDSLRGVAALAVCVLHFNLDSHLFEPARVLWIAVDFFFVLSGFVVLHAYGDRLGTAAERVGFLVRRAGRLWPLHAVTLTVLVGYEGLKLIGAQWFGQALARPAFTGLNLASELPAQFALLHALSPWAHSGWNIPSWSISAEFYVYLLLAGLSLVGIAGRSACWLLPAACGAAATWLLSDLSLGTNEGFARCVYGFFTGCALRSLAPVKQAALRHATALELALLCAGMGPVILATQHSRAALLVAPPVFAAMIWVFAHEGGAVSRLLAARPLQALGRWSYSIYMVHFPLYAVLFTPLIRLVGTRAGLLEQVPWVGPTEVTMRLSLGSPWAMDAVVAACITAVIGVSAVSHRYLEEPGRAMGNKLAAWLDARRAVPAMPAAPTVTSPLAKG